MLRICKISNFQLRFFRSLVIFTISLRFARGENYQLRFAIGKVPTEVSSVIILAMDLQRDIISIYVYFPQDVNTVDEIHKI